MRSLPIALLLSLASLTAHAATYRVDGDAGDDANDGLAAPFKTIARGLRDLKPGDTLLLTKLSHPYRESIPVMVHGTREAPIIIDGGGATISGADPAPKDGWTDNGGIWSVAQATKVEFLFGSDCRYEMAKAPDKLKPLEWAWQTGKLYFCPAEGKTPADYDLQMSVRISGIMTSGAGEIIVRNLTAMHFYNDGFNIHQGSSPMWFENIKGLWNGDEGFSCHENCECYVRGAEFSHNYWHGIADVGVARSHYQNMICRDNRSKGIHFIGGMHSVSDAEVSGSPIQIALSASDQQGYPRFEAMPLRTSVTNLRNVAVRSQPDAIGVLLTPNAQAVIEHCVIQGGKTCLQVEEGASAYTLNSILAGGQIAEVLAAGSYGAEANLYFPGRLTIKDTTYQPDQFAAYVAATGNDQKSIVEEPKFVGDTLVTSKASHATGGAFNLYGFGGPDIGLERRQVRPEEPGVAAPLPGATQLAATGGTPQKTERGELISYDFETVNPWGRIYPEPVKNAAGVEVAGKAELSTEQAHGGAKSGKISVTLPPAAPGRYLLKLFSEKMPYTRPVSAVRVWVYGDNSGRQFTLRLRDAGGECFYRAPAVMDWSGWKQIAWDVTAEPPANIIGGNGNRQQDCPPLEVVLDVSAKAGEQFVVYLDDLEVELAK
ncbi:right-handed parallel beta-helix repeat-containing protein [bacterium]|nr:right-handed parallel beta-helix repeat-containing protein [bacterium]